MDWVAVISQKARISGLLHVGDLARTYKLSTTAVYRALCRLRARNLVEPIASKVFLNRLALDFSGREVIGYLRPNSYLSLETVLRDSGISSQTPRQLTCITTGKQGAYTTSVFSIAFHRISPRYYWGFHEKRTRYGRYKIADPEKALLDWIYLNRRLGRPFPTDELNLNGLDLKKLLAYSVRFTNPVRLQVLELVAANAGEQLHNNQGTSPVFA